MADGTPIGALAVRIGADASELIGELKKADTALGRTSSAFGEGVGAAAKFAGAASVAGAAVLAFTTRAADAADELGKLSQKIGVSVESLSALKYAASVNNLSLEQLGTGLRQLSKYMVENRITGISVENQLLKIADEFAGAADGIGKTTLAMKYFGKSGADLIPFLNQGSAGIAELRKEAEKLGIIINADVAKAANEFNDNLTKLKASSEALAIKMAGPLVDAISKATKAMLDAKLEGEDFFTVWAEGWRTLVTGDDADKWSKEMVDATNRLLDAQNALDRARSNTYGSWITGGKNVEKALASVATAQAEVNRLQSIKQILVPEIDKPAGGGSEVNKPEIEVPGGDAELGKQLQEQMDVEVQIRAEQAQIISDMRAAELEKERAFYNERNRILMEAYDREQEEAIRQGQETIAIDEQIRQTKKQQQAYMLTDAAGFLSNLASLTNTSSRKAFEFGKAASLAQAGIKTGLAVIDAWEAGMSVGGPYAPVVAAAYAGAALAAGANYMNNIRKQSFGGGGGAPTPAGQGSSGVAAPVASAPAQSSNRQTGPDTFISLSGDSMYSDKSVRALLKRLESSTKDGGRIFVVEPS